MTIPSYYAFRDRRIIVHCALCIVHCALKSHRLYRYIWHYFMSAADNDLLALFEAGEDGLVGGGGGAGDDFAPTIQT